MYNGWVKSKFSAVSHFSDEVPENRKTCCRAYMKVCKTVLIAIKAYLYK